MPAAAALSLAGTVGGEDLVASGSLPEGRGRPAVESHCGVCHSLRLVTQNRGDAAHWRALVQRMQSLHGMWAVPPQTEARIAAYLAAHFPAREALRRRPLAPELLPPDDADPTP